MNKPIAESELILNSNGSVYHLQLLPEHLGENIILVGDPGRVETVSRLFDTVDLRIHNREFVTHGGTYKGRRILVISSGIGTDNIDIVLNELDAVANIDLKTRLIKEKHKALNIVRLGTSGALQADIPVNSFVLSEYAIGFDGLLNYYQALPSINENALSEAFKKQTNWSDHLPYPYCIKGSDVLIQKLEDRCMKGITATAPGFYAPQGRKLRLDPWVVDFNQQLKNFTYGEKRIFNFEMETSALYGLGKLLGHQTCTICVVIANRETKKFSSNYAPHMQQLIEFVLERLTS
ncbi:MAG TPA: nucleoside phosphorylase [Bacteroidia bacterium]|jgi:uridine phosphorylase|nr:nucleoside phosphorylase [Bacteroidia bacterium]